MFGRRQWPLSRPEGGQKRVCLKNRMEGSGSVVDLGKL